ncbi:asparagine--tRNA ligase [Dethiosulfovibrio salsuginis]|uniref:Asparagine--tRNA ligase n=1 Tax=Dethiosulfovibrio salsuginis TaxID=561720 RepID=A0A1X7JQY0_9BACT|nr:asparagine--tRNA ligase [Dethiosulfovibrio salsuginis]SMG30731.1 asparaginyl-tRNA synthetase [Dethiosulfovibrio salsuginis]
MGTPWISIKEMIGHLGEEVVIKGWMYNKRSSGKIHFLQIRDGSGFVQAVMVKNEVSEEAFDEAKKLWMETSLEVTGTVRADDRSASGVELSVSSIKVVHNPTDEYPIGKKDHGVDFLLDNRHLWLRSQRQRAIMTVRERIIWSWREFFHNKDFMLVDSPIITGAIGEGASGLFELDYFDQKAYLAQTGQLYAEAAAAAYGKVYCFGPTFRAEKSKTRRHLTEFWMLEPEVAFYDHKDNMDLQEELVRYTVEQVLEHCPKELALLERDLDPLKSVTEGPFYHINYRDAVVKLNELGSSIAFGDDLGAEDETVLTQQYDRPIFVECYPKGAKAFYMKENPDDVETVLCADLLAPEGYGEIIGGSQREDDLGKLVSRMEADGLDMDSYQWYLDLRRYGTFVHSGFGIGLERTVAWICGLHHIREVIPWPRTIYRLNP